MTNAEKDKLSPGDLMRMCAHCEADSVAHGYISWLYGLYVGIEQDIYHDSDTPRDLIFCKNRTRAFDNYWYIERIS